MSKLAQTKYYSLLLFFFFSYSLPTSTQTPVSVSKTPYVTKHVLKNGLTILVRKVSNLQKVAIELWYGVGSKHEGTGEKGIAHLIEHMLFKGTDKMSESDIQLIGNKLSMYWNAWTSQDFTTMKFCLPISEWRHAMPILADCMCHCTFDQELLNSEMKVVVQELKLYRDDIQDLLRQEIMAAVFPDHPYHYPIIGHKHDLFNVGAQTLKNFYKKHYVPNNATLVVVGNVNPDEVIKQAERHFGAIPAADDYKKQEFFHSTDLRSQSVSLYRDIKKPYVSLVFAIPGMAKKSSYVSKIMADILGADKVGRLSRRLVDELQLIDSIHCYELGLIDHGLFFISFELMKEDSLEKIISVIHQEIKDIALNGCPLDELQGFINCFEVARHSLLESNDDQADLIGQFYVATGDENFLFSQFTSDPTILNNKIKEFARTYLRPSLMHKGMIYPLPKEEKDCWLQIQQDSDNADNRILEGKMRTADVQPGKYVNAVPPCSVCIPECPKPETFTLNNGIKVLYYHTDYVPMLNLSLSLKADSDYEPESQPGIYKCLRYMLQESGTEKRSAEELAKELARYGITINDTVWFWSSKMMSKDLSKACELMTEMIAKPRFTKATLQKIKPWLESDYTSLWDNEKAIAALLQNQEIFKGQPQGRRHYANLDEIKKITLKEVKEVYKNCISPDGATLSIVGDLSGIKDLKSLLNKTFGSWQGKPIAQLEYPNISKPSNGTRTHYINRDQVVVGLGGISKNCLDADYDALSLYDSNLHSRLFKLRMKSGDFYSISGTVCGQATRQPGAWKIMTIASSNKVTDVERAIREFIQNDSEAFNEEDLAEARRTLLTNAQQHYTSNDSMSRIFLTLDRLGLPFDYYQQRCKKLCGITVDDVKRAVKRVLNPTNMCSVLVGRIQKDASQNLLSF
jgi:zinc protease